MADNPKMSIRETHISAILVIDILGITRYPCGTHRRVRKNMVLQPERRREVCKTYSAISLYSGTSAFITNQPIR